MYGIVPDIAVRRNNEMSKYVLKFSSLIIDKPGRGANAHQIWVSRVNDAIRPWQRVRGSGNTTSVRQTAHGR